VAALLLALGPRAAATRSSKADRTRENSPMKRTLVTLSTLILLGFAHVASIMCTYSPYGYAYTGIDLALATDAGANKDFTQRFTVTGVPICDD